MVRRHCPRITAAAGLAALLLAGGCSDAHDSGATASGQPPVSEPGPSSTGTAREPQPAPSGAPTAEDIARATAPPAAREPDTIDWSGGDPGKGLAVYSMYCLTCHGPDGKGEGPSAAALDPKPRDFSTGRFYIDANANNETGEDVDLARVIREGTGAFGGSPAMPGWKAFSEQQVRDLVAYVQQFGRASRSRS